MAESTVTATANPANRGVVLRLGALLLAVIVVLALRRPSQFLNPYVWVEDAGWNIPQFLELGWGIVFEPMVGYFVLPSRLVFAISASLSFNWYPEISLALTVLLTFAVVSAVAFSPIDLRWRFVCALAILLIPTHPEVFAVPLYTGWWVSLLAILPLIWRTDGGNTALRVIYVVVGGLSSPLVVILAPLYALRLAILRRRDELVVAIACAATVLTQAYALRSSDALEAVAGVPYDFYHTVARFFGLFIYRGEPPAITTLTFLSGLALIVLLMVIVVKRGGSRLTGGLLFGAITLTILSSVSRVFVGALDPGLTGPRYFFFPYILILWAVIQGLSIKTPAIRVGAVVAISGAMFNLLSHGAARHEPITWRLELAACARHPGQYGLPVHYDGTTERLLRLPIRGEDCRRLIESSLWRGG
jgi:hypothetical protein